MDIKNQKHLICNDLIDIEEFDSNLLDIEKKESIGANIYYVEYIREWPDEIITASPIYLHIDELFGYIDKINDKKHLNISLTPGNGDILLAYEKMWNDIRKEIKEVNDGKDVKNDRNIKRIKFESDDDLPLDKPLKLHRLMLTIRHVIEINEKYYPQIFLGNCLYEV